MLITIWNIASYVMGSCDFALVVHNGFSKRYRKRKLVLPTHKNLLRLLQFTKQILKIYYKSNMLMANNGS